jgi:HSP20 family molecular chaperone IbpA
MSYTLANMGLGNVRNIFDFVNDSLGGDEEWTKSWKDWSTDNNSLFNETEDGYAFYIPFAGLGKDNVKVSVADNRVKVEAKGEAAGQEVDYARSFSVPNKADVTTLEAKMENGLLSITISKKEKDKNRTINVA